MTTNHVQKELLDIQQMQQQIEANQQPVVHHHSIGQRVGGNQHQTLSWMNARSYSFNTTNQLQSSNSNAGVKPRGFPEQPQPTCTNPELNTPKKLNRFSTICCGSMAASESIAQPAYSKLQNHWFGSVSNVQQQPTFNMNTQQQYSSIPTDQHQHCSNVAYKPWIGSNSAAQPQHSSLLTVQPQRQRSANSLAQIKHSSNATVQPRYSSLPTAYHQYRSNPTASTFSTPHSQRRHSSNSTPQHQGTSYLTAQQKLRMDTPSEQLSNLYNSSIRINQNIATSYGVPSNVKTFTDGAICSNSNHYINISSNPQRNALRVVADVSDSSSLGHKPRKQSLKTEVSEQPKNVNKSPAVQGETASLDHQQYSFIKNHGNDIVTSSQQTPLSSSSFYYPRYCARVPVQEQQPQAPSNQSTLVECLLTASDLISSDQVKVFPAPFVQLPSINEDSDGLNDADKHDESMRILTELDQSILFNNLDNHKSSSDEPPTSAASDDDIQVTIIKEARKKVKSEATGENETSFPVTSDEAISINDSIEDEASEKEPNDILSIMGELGIDLDEKNGNFSKHIIPDEIFEHKEVVAEQIVESKPSLICFDEVRNKVKYPIIGKSDVKVPCVQKLENTTDLNCTKEIKSSMQQLKREAGAPCYVVVKSKSSGKLIKSYPFFNYLEEFTDKLSTAGDIPTDLEAQIVWKSSSTMKADEDSLDKGMGDGVVIQQLLSVNDVTEIDPADKVPSTILDESTTHSKKLTFPSLKVYFSPPDDELSDTDSDIDYFLLQVDSNQLKQSNVHSKNESKVDRKHNKLLKSDIKYRKLMKDIVSAPQYSTWEINRARKRLIERIREVDRKRLKYDISNIRDIYNRNREQTLHLATKCAVVCLYDVFDTGKDAVKNEKRVKRKMKKV